MRKKTKHPAGWLGAVQEKFQDVSTSYKAFLADCNGSEKGECYKQSSKNSLISVLPLLVFGRILSGINGRFNRVVVKDPSFINGIHYSYLFCNL